MNRFGKQFGSSERWFGTQSIELGINWAEIKTDTWESCPCAPAGWQFPFVEMCMGKNPNYRSNLNAIQLMKCRVVFRVRRNQSRNYMFRLYFRLPFRPNLIQIRYFLFQIEFKVDRYLEIFGVSGFLSWPVAASARSTILSMSDQTAIVARYVATLSRFFPMPMVD